MVVDVYKRQVFILQIQEWFKAVVTKDDDTMKLLSKAILDKDEKQIARQLNIVMGRIDVYKRQQYEYA